MARGSFICNVSIVGLWLGTGGGLWPDSFDCNANIVFFGWVQEMVWG